MENGERLVGILKHSILINSPSQINAPGPQTLFYEFRSCFNKHPLSNNNFLFFGGGGGGGFIGTTTEFGKKCFRSRWCLFASGRLLQ